MSDAKTGIKDLGVTMWHSSCEDSGPDVGISVGLGNAAIFAGEVPGEAGPWSIALYQKGQDRITVAKTVDQEAARGMVERVSSTLTALTARIEALTADLDKAQSELQDKEASADYWHQESRIQYEAKEKARAERDALAEKLASGGVSAISAERARQIEQEGWTPEHDDANDRGEIAGAAACYAMQAVLDCIGRRELADTVKHTIRELWPWSAHWWKTKNRRADLVRAGALIAAEIDRIDRATLAAIKDGGE